MSLPHTHGANLGTNEMHSDIKEHYRLMLIIAGIVGGLLLAVMLVTICKVKRCAAKQTRNSVIEESKMSMEPVGIND
ncbi:hypothetical protein DPEC_G00024970 [Dallia pectoralis]|uniref:Uncharacterized protein n=1 Tax=Dallia pectoralis TaxID=75939 RepID=A0ACC2HHU1_DALPE|nr:hypothetical protein DPEC_G00024970 [Dallia pectoralis]